LERAFEGCTLDKEDSMEDIQDIDVYFSFFFSDYLKIKNYSSFFFTTAAFFF
jgi:hypothetical protein